MTKISILGALALVASTPAAASDAEAGPRRVKIADAHAEYVSTLGENGILHLVGEDKRSGKRFRFAVRKNGEVRGQVGGQLVAFRVSQQVREAALRRLAVSPSS